MKSLNKINTVIRAASFVGVMLSIYAYVVELSKEHDSNYSAMCDINEHMSCSRVFTSKYGRGFGFMHHLVGQDSIFNQPNSVGGVAFYLMFIVMSFMNTVEVTNVLIGFSVLSNVCSVYLACILYFVLHDFCIVCVSTYIINAINLALIVMKLRSLQESSDKSKDN